MHRDYWVEKWIKNDIGFHQETVNKFLLHYYPKEKLPQNPYVLVPLCGKSNDLLWFKQQNAFVSGCELSSIACEKFFDEHGLQYTKQRQNNFTLYTVNQINIWNGDFFSLTKAMLGKVDFCYDRAALIALPRAMRKQYAKHLGKLLDSQTYYLLITLTYETPGEIGPPFSVDYAEIQELFADDFDIKYLVASNEEVNAIPKLAAAGGLNLVSHVYLLCHK